MKKIIYLLALTLMLCLGAAPAWAAVAVGPPSKETIAAMTPEERQARLAEIKARIAEIKSADRSQLTKAERKSYRAELKSLKKEASAYDVLYIGVGALVILIILVLILF
jgi:Skp family chaperone for outer membrane proteins